MVSDDSYIIGTPKGEFNIENPFNAMLKGDIAENLSEALTRDNGLYADGLDKSSVISISIDEIHFLTKLIYKQGLAEREFNWEEIKNFLWVNKGQEIKNGDTEKSAGG